MKDFETGFINFFMSCNSRKPPKKYYIIDNV